MEQWREEIAEIRALMAERERLALERDKLLRQEWEKDRQAREQERQAREQAREQERLAREQEGIERQKREKEVNERFEKDMLRYKELNAMINGISDSNGLRVENYFYTSLCNKMSFGGYEFDEIDKGLKKQKKMPDGTRLQGEYDVIMYNGNTIALIEIKSRARSGDVNKLINKQLNNFKTLLPQFAHYTFLLGLAADSFDDEAIKEAKDQGVGILMPIGDVVEIIDDHLKTF